MKTAWVMTKEERKLRNEGRMKMRKPPKNNINIEVGDNPSSGHIHYISEEEMAEVNYYVEISDYHENSKVHDMDSLLIREIIRWVLYVLVPRNTFTYPNNILT